MTADGRTSSADELFSLSFLVTRILARESTGHVSEAQFETQFTCLGRIRKGVHTMVCKYHTFYLLAGLNKQGAGRRVVPPRQDAVKYFNAQEKRASNRSSISAGDNKSDTNTYVSNIPNPRGKGFSPSLLRFALRIIPRKALLPR